jgi:hypothetical protein
MRQAVTIPAAIAMIALAARSGAWAAAGTRISLLPPPTLGESGHRGLAWHAVLVLPKGKRP